MFRSFPLSRILLVVLLVGLLSAALTLRLAAQGPDNGEPGGSSPVQPAQKSLDEEMGGAPAQPAPGPVVDVPGGDGEPERKPITAPSVIYEEELESSRAPGLAQYFKRWSAASFTAYDDSNTWAYNGGGCFHRTGGASWWDTSVQVPEGAEIDYLRVYYYDIDAANNAIAYLYQYDDVGGTSDIAWAAGSGTAGYGSAGSGFFSHIADNTNSSYSVRINFGGGTTSALRICAVRIRYQYTFAALTLPAIMNLAP